MADFPGPHCQQNGISKTNLDDGNVHPIKELSNGVVVEIHSYLEKSGRNSSHLFCVISGLDPKLKNTTVKTLKSKITRLCDQKKKLISKKKVPGVKNIKDFMNATFSVPVSTKKCENSPEKQKCENNSSTALTETILQIQNIHVHDDLETEKPCVKSVCVQTTVICDDSDDENLQKETNLLKYVNAKQLKHSKQLQKTIAENTEQLQNIKSRVGHYSVRNVNKRDENAKKNLHSLRDAQRLVRKHENIFKHTNEKLKEKEACVERLTHENQLMAEKINEISEQLQVVSNSITNEKSKKLSVQKVNSYLRNEIKTLRAKIKEGLQDDKQSVDQTCEKCEVLNDKLQEKDHQISELEQDVNDMRTVKLKTKNDDGSYKNEMRLCVIELAGLEVAVEKVSPVIQSVLQHILGTHVDSSDLPNPTTTQTIVDEGHYLAKTFISEKLDNSKNWGLGRDGTTRKKQKIVDTSVTLDSGDVISLGFDRVFKENAVTINSVTKKHLHELGKLHENLAEENNDLFLVRSLEKLAYTMSDRASNEKLANKLLDEWRDDMLKNFDGDKNIVHNFHCMAHVLLGFHSYVTPGMKKLETELVESGGPVGRDALPVFKTWSKKETVVERVVRTTSDVFGPAGDHHGIRDRWDAYCAANGIKSLIGNYRDNRFNAIFETAAEVFLHRQDFLRVIETVDKPNLKLKSVKTDLASDIVCALLQCFGLFFVKITGPYWNLVTSEKVTYLDLSPHILELKQCLAKCVETPAHLLNQSEHWTSTDPLEIKEVPHHQRYLQSLFTLQEETRELLFKTIPIVATGMISVINKQLADFIDGGKYHGTVTESERQRTKFAPVTNLGCEHHFGDLDSSQRRRPSASMHHHSSVQLLKRNRSPMMKWLSEMKSDDRSSLMFSARKGGRGLRKEHISSERKVLSEIHNEMTTTKDKKRKGDVLEKGKQRRRLTTQTSSDASNVNQNHTFTENEYVAIAYQDSWYPGIVVKVNENKTAQVKFMARCRKKNYFQWPSREDTQTVEKQFILSNGFIPDCSNSGRQWCIKECEEIEKLYDQFQYLYF